MKYVRTIEEFLACFFNNNYCYNVNSLDFIDEFRLGYTVWDDLRKYALEKASSNPDFYAILGEMYLFGKDVDKDINQAIKYFDQGIEEGSLYCIKSKANQLINGDYLERDYKEAFRLFEIASNKGFHHAMNNLGWMYTKGIGCRLDEEKGGKLIKMAADLGSTIACFNYGVFIINLNFDEGLKYITQSAMGGYPKAQNYLGELYFIPEYLHLDYEKAFYWFQEATLNFNEYAMKSLGDMYRDGLYVKKDYKRAEYYYKLAVDYGYDYATVYIAQLYNEMDKEIK